MLENEEGPRTPADGGAGKPLAESRAEIAYAASFYEWFGEEGKRSTADTIPTYAADRRIVVTKDPIGVTAAFTPWNFPLRCRRVSPHLRSPPLHDGVEAC